MRNYKDKTIAIVGAGEDLGKVAMELAKLGHANVIIVTPENAKDILTAPPKTLPIKSYDIPYIPLATTFQEPKNYINGKKLKRKHKK